MTRLIAPIIIALWQPTEALSQGWQLMGPDSANWRTVTRVTGKWLSPTSYRLAATCYSSIALYVSGGQWDYRLRSVEGNPVFLGFGYYSYDFSPWDDSVYIGYADYFTEPDFKMFKSLFPFTTWSNRLPGSCWQTPLRAVFSPNDSTVFSTQCGMHRSTDRGRTWTSLQLSTSVYFAEVLGFNEASSRIVYKAEATRSYLTQVVVSTDRGITWDTLATPTFPFAWPNAGGPLSLVARGDTIVIGVLSMLFDSTSNVGVFRTTNAGATWAQVYARDRIYGIVRSSVSQNTLYAAAEEGILKSTNYGATWSLHNNSLPTNRITSLIISPYSDTLFVSTTTHGVLKVWNYLVAVREKDEIPREPALYQNYPNPFNSATTIRFQVGEVSRQRQASSEAGGQKSEVSHVTLKVYDLLGREVATLVNEEMKPGSYQRVFNAEGLASGVYLYRFTAGAYSQTRKLILLR